MKASPLAELNTVPHRVVSTKEADGTILLTSGYEIDPVVAKTGDWLHHWAKETPQAIFLAEREGNGWREHSYAEVLAMVRAIASSLLTRGFQPDRPIAIMSGNGVDHALLSFAAQYIGVPYVPIAEQYSLIPEAHGRLIYVLEKTKPAMVFVDDAARYGEALKLPQLEGVEIVAVKTDGAPVPVTSFSELLKSVPGQDVETAYAKVGPDTVAKVLFTSGSSSDPKGVLTTQRMMCTNQAQMSVVLPFLKDRPPRITDWLPWNHVFGGSSNVNMMLAHGGTLRVDQGKPTKVGFKTTLENLRSKPGTLCFNVPLGYAMLVQAMEEDLELREAFFADLDLIFYAGASLPQTVWTRLEEMALEIRGRLPLMISSWGMTETAPATLMVHEPIGRSGIIGVPLPETQIKLMPDEDMRCELRVKGPNIMPGYWSDKNKTAEAFDEEGFLITGDAVRFVDSTDPERGLMFDGRVSEDFKLLSGTWVQAGKLRLEALEALKDHAQDVVICGHDRGEIGIFIFPKPDQLGTGDVSDGAVVASQITAEIHEVLRSLGQKANGSAKSIRRAIILATPPSLKDHEITDKGSLNVNKIMTRRKDMLERLYDNEDPAVIRIE